MYRVRRQILTNTYVYCDNLRDVRRWCGSSVGVSLDTMAVTVASVDSGFRPGTCCRCLFTRQLAQPAPLGWPRSSHAFSLAVQRPKRRKRASLSASGRHGLDQRRREVSGGGAAGGASSRQRSSLAGVSLCVRVRMWR